MLQSNRVKAALGLGRQQSPPAAPAGDATLYEVIPESLPEASPARDRLSSQRDMPTLAEAMRLHIERALAATRGRIEGRKGAAAMLDINPHTLRARMRKLGVDASRFRE